MGVVGVISMREAFYLLAENGLNRGRRRIVSDETRRSKMNSDRGRLWLAATFGIAVLSFACTAPASTPTSPQNQPSTGQPGLSATGGQVVAPGGNVIQVRDDARLGKILVDATGKTLYRYDADGKGTSNCTGGCTQTWLPLLLPTGDPKEPDGLPGELEMLTRPDGGRQVMYNDAPLYRFAGDTQTSDAKGDSPNGPWHVVHAVG